MADDWDLYALVRSCTTADSSSSTISAAANLEEASSADFASMSFQDDDHNPFHFPTFLDNENNSFQGLEEIFKELYVNPHPILTTSQMTAAMSISFLAEPENQQQMEQQHPHMNSSRATSSLSVQTTTPQPNRSRRRKNQQAKIVHQMTQEELSTDSWAWRKYGQKPIKGSPYPRNYYRCSTLKGCVARKQVERSPTDPNMFVVSYTGEHSHPRPIHRSSLAGSTRNKSSGFKKPTSRDSTVVDTDIAMSKASCCSSSPASASSFSPKVESEEAAHEGTEKEEFDVEKDVKMVEEDEDDEDLLNPNMAAMSEEILENFNNLFELV